MRHLEPTWSMPLAGGVCAHVITTDRSHGNLAVASSAPALGELEANRRSIVDAPWSWVHQVHGAAVAVVLGPGDQAGSRADALCTTAYKAPISVQTADCAAVGLVSPTGVVGLAHAGWKGLVAGVIGATVDAMRELGAEEIVAVLGPCIHPAQYQFGAEDLALVERQMGASLRSVTADGSPALDVPAAVQAALTRQDVTLVAELGGCTAAEPDRYWSHRARRDAQRQAMVVWMDKSDSYPTETSQP